MLSQGLVNIALHTQQCWSRKLDHVSLHALTAVYTICNNTHSDITFKQVVVIKDNITYYELQQCKLHATDIILCLQITAPVWSLNFQNSFISRTSIQISDTVLSATWLDRCPKLLDWCPRLLNRYRAGSRRLYASVRTWRGNALLPHYFCISLLCNMLHHLACITSISISYSRLNYYLSSEHGL